MNLDIDPRQAHTLDQWAVWFKGEFAPQDLDENGMVAYLQYFADVGVLEFISTEDKWRISGIEVDSNLDGIREKVLNTLEKISLTERGFAVSYFLGHHPEVSTVSNKTTKPLIANKSAVNKNTQAPNLEKASDLSNLQIVKKVGRQLQPFLEFERETVARLMGTHTQKKEARVIFNFILRHTRKEAEPKKWEQLSRKRHR
jgi:hypothetical protein